MMNITLVTVTYGSRWHLLNQLLDSAVSNGIDRFVIVNNGSQEDIESLVSSKFGSKGKVLTLSRNTGSAGGFRKGLEFAVSICSEFVFLVDDDNVIGPQCVPLLIATHKKWLPCVANNCLIVQAFRDRQFDQAAGIPSIGMYGGSQTAFFGFHILDVPVKFLRRIKPVKQWIAGRPVSSELSVFNSPYSGMFFRIDLIATIGYPDERFVLYCDDVEYSSRITRRGGKIVLVTDAKLLDLEESWDAADKVGNSFDARLVGDGDFRAFYSARNTAYFHYHVLSSAGAIFSLNKLFFLGFLLWRAVRLHRVERFRLIYSAIMVGRKGILGESLDFPLS